MLFECKLICPSGIVLECFFRPAESIEALYRDLERTVWPMGYFEINKV